uniref:Uncharacterized protein n=1 Tax=Branchiostoma floridae TaxID=7739 RepID=C3ZGY4_BRAFL|eukprot:XP_002592120.1 hypothetical protein BRAFLDRAFT_84991 [Branchiostoma floridae]
MMYRREVMRHLHVRDAKSSPRKMSPRGKVAIKTKAINSQDQGATVQVWTPPVVQPTPVRQKHQLAPAKNKPMGFSKPWERSVDIKEVSFVSQRKNTERSKGPGLYSHSTTVITWSGSEHEDIKVCRSLV